MNRYSKRLTVLMILFVFFILINSSCSSSGYEPPNDYEDETTEESYEATNNYEDEDEAEDETTEELVESDDEMVSFDRPGPVLYILLILAILFVMGGIMFLFMPFDLWLKVLSTKIWVWPLALIRMRIQKINLKLVVDNLITARKSGLKTSINELESLYLSGVDVSQIIESLIRSYNGHVEVTIQELKSHALSGGNVTQVVHALVAANSADLKLPPEKQLHLSFKAAAAIDHAGINVYEAVEHYIKPKVVETEEIIAVAKDGIELTAHARITIRTNMAKIVLGADEATIVAQVNEKVVSIIGTAESHKEILENAREVGEKVMRERDQLFEDTAFDVLSIDISSIKVGKDVNAALEEEKANAKLSHEKARAQEMKNKMTEAEIEHINAESEVQKAMADAFRDGHLKVQDYFNLMNTEADTEMRKSFSYPPVKDPKNLKK